MGESLGSVVVAGGSVAGLLAAAVVSPHADRVTILDRDVLPHGAERRRGVPQGAHVHALLPGGAAIVERLLPGLGVEFEAAESPVLDMGRDVNWLSPFGLGLRITTSLPLFTGSRPLLESVIRRRVLELPGIECRAGEGVSGLVVSDGAVRGIRLGSDEVVDADVVIDATGRASRAPEWLTAVGYDAPEETVVDADLGYASVIVEAPMDSFPGARAGYIQVAPPEHLRGAIAFPIEGDRFMLTLIGTGGDHPPRDINGFRAFARSLRDPMIADLLWSGSPVGPIQVFGATANRYRHYESVRSLPAGFLVTGDAACAFNPVYGQGMTAAAMAAGALDRCLARREVTPERLSRRFPHAFRKAVKVPWMMATSADLDTAGVRAPLPVRMMNRYVARVMAASTWSARTRMRLVEVMGLAKPPTNLFAPGVIADVVHGGRKAEEASKPPVALGEVRSPAAA